MVACAGSVYVGVSEAAAAAAHDRVAAVGGGGDGNAVVAAWHSNCEDS